VSSASSTPAVDRYLQLRCGGAGRALGLAVQAEYWAHFVRGPSLSVAAATVAPDCLSGYQGRLGAHAACGGWEEIFMIEGTLIAESLRVGTNLENLKLTVRKISRYRAQGTTPGQPGIWTTLDFEAEVAGAGELAQAFAGVLERPGWYVNFESPVESFVVFPGRIFRYPRGDEAGRAAAQAYGRQLAIPEPQLDWTV
jgi:hypothetical protein